MQKTKKILAALLALVMVLGVMPAGVFAKTIDCDAEVHTHTDDCYKLVCESVEHEHKACNLACDIDAHTHCHPTTCEIEAHEHKTCTLACELDAHAHCYAFVCDKDEHTHDDACYKRDAAELVTDIGDIEFVVGEPTEFTFSTVANDDAGIMVVGASDFSDPDAIEKLEYYEPNTDAWYDLNGEFGGSNGFPMADATSKFRVTFAEAGEFTFTSIMKKADTDEVLCSVEATAVVVEAEPETPVEPEQPEEPATPDIDPDARCGKYEHKHNACNLSCKLYTHTHCNGDTCEIEEHEHKACTLACDKEVHIHCYPATEVEDEEPETPDVPETPDEPEEPEEPAENIVIDELHFSVTAPVAGEELFYDFAIESDVDFVADVFGLWAENDIADITGEGWELLIEDGDVYKDGKYYALVLAFEIPEGFEIPDDVITSINGMDFEEVYIDAGDEEFAPSFNAVYVFDNLVAEDEEPETPDEPETPVTPVVPDVEGYTTKCAKPAHKHNACNLSCTIEEHEHCFSDKCAKEHEHCYVKKTVEPEAPEYAIVEGANGEWKDNAEAGLTFKSDAAFADFTGVKVDGAAIDAANYEAKEGSTVVTLKPAYLKTLAVGEHTLTIVSEDGEASTKFTITHEHKLTKVEAKKETCTEKGNSEYYTCDCGKWFKDDKAETEIVDKTSVEIKAAGHTASKDWSRDAKSHWHKCTVCKEAADEKVAHDFDKETGKICQTCKYDVDNPKTGSEAHISAMAIIMTVSTLVMAGVGAWFVWDKKRK